MSKILGVYSTILGGFYAQTEELANAVAKAKQEAGDDVWKQGFSGWAPKGATKIAKDIFEVAKIAPLKAHGNLLHVGFVENSDKAGNKYPKLRVSLLSGEQEIMLSIDMKSDVAQRLINKLDNCQQGNVIAISAWPDQVERNGRTYINHAVSVKRDDGTEVPVNPELGIAIKAKTDAIEPALKAAGIGDAKVIAAAKINKRIESYTELLMGIEKRFPVAAQATAEAVQ